MADKMKVGIIGATGYAGVELVRLLLAHDGVELAAVSSVSFEGKSINEIYPSLNKIYTETLLDDVKVVEKCDVIFGALPHGLSEKIAKVCIDKNKIFVDLGADFRLNDESVYKKWYGLDYAYPTLHEGAVYSIPELHRAKLVNAKIVANPGCYPTSVALGIAPAVKAGLVSVKGIIVDSKSGVTGAGRSLSQTTHFPDCNEAFGAYKVAGHRHNPEIEQTISELANESATVTFVPHLLPVNRGIESTIYADLAKTASAEEVHKLYTDFYKNEKFVRVLPLGQSANIKNVTLSNYCDISVHLDEHTKKLVVSSVIDNMVKGASGQAIQNMNILCGFEESMGIDFIPPAF